MKCVSRTARSAPGRSGSSIVLGVLVGAACALALTGALAAQEMAVPVEVQWSLFDRILAFDRAFPEHAGTEVVVGILYQDRYRLSLAAFEGISAAARGAEGRVLGGSALRIVPLKEGSPEELDRRLREEDVDVLYVAPLRAVSLTRIAEVSRLRGVITLTGVPLYVQEGMAIGLDLRGGKPDILVNLEACKAVGMELSSELLKLATMVGR